VKGTGKAKGTRRAWLFGLIVFLAGLSYIGWPRHNPLDRLRALKPGETYSSYPDRVEDGRRYVSHKLRFSQDCATVRSVFEKEKSEHPGKLLKPYIDKPLSATIDNPLPAKDRRRTPGPPQVSCYALVYVEYEPTLYTDIRDFIQERLRQ
jgi:hypothetical protein